MIHLTSETKDQVFQLRDGWRLIFQGVVPRATWRDRGGAEAALSLLKSGYSVLTPDGSIKHVGSTQCRRCAGEGRQLD